MTTTTNIPELPPLCGEVGFLTPAEWHERGYRFIPRADSASGEPTQVMRISELSAFLILDDDSFSEDESEALADSVVPGMYVAAFAASEAAVLESFESLTCIRMAATPATALAASREVHLRSDFHAASPTSAARPQFLFLISH